jgi:hypothetical protein
MRLQLVHAFQREQVVGGRVQDVFELGPRLGVLLQFEERPAQRDPR